MAAILAALTLAHWITVWELIALASLLGVVNAFDIPARQSFLVEMVGSEDLMNAIALNSSMFNGARVVGPAIAGILVASIGEGWCFFANAVSFIAVIVGSLMMKITAAEKRAIRQNDGTYRGRISICAPHRTCPQLCFWLESLVWRAFLTPC